MISLVRNTLILLLVGTMATSSWAAATPRAKVSTLVNASSLHAGDEGVLAVVVDIADGFHAQSHTPSEEQYIAFEVKMDDAPGVTFSPPIYPTGKNETYPALGTLNVYTARVVVFVPFKVKPDASVGSTLKLSGHVNYQICDNNACYMPEAPAFAATTKIVPPSEPAVKNDDPVFAGYQSGAKSVARTEGGDWSIASAFGAAFLAGLLFNVMPCVLPVLPLKAMGFYEVSQHRRSKCLLLGIVFSLGVIAVFAVLSVLVVGLGWIQWGDQFSKPWFVWLMVLLLVGSALSLFGFYTFSLPIGAYRFEPRHDTYVGNFLMGVFTSILATPCTAPLLPSLLIWAAARPASIGVPAIICVGVGMAFPYFLLSAFPEIARRFPRTGPWPKLFEQMMGFMLFAVAGYFAGGRLVHGPAFWWVPTIIIAIACVFLVVRTIQLAPRTVPIAISSVIAVLLLGSALVWTIRINGHPWETYSAERFDSARHEGKIVLVKFTANWCATCQVIEGNVYQDAKTWETLKRYGVVPLKVDLTDSQVPGKDLLLKLNPSGGIPLTAIFSPNREDPIVLASIYSTSELLAALDEATKKAIAEAR